MEAIDGKRVKNKSALNFIHFYGTPTYAGKVLIKGEEKILIDGVHQAIVSLELYFQVQEMLGELRFKNKGRAQKKTDREELVLRRFLKCGQCRQTLTGSCSKGNGGSYFYYHCQDGCKVRFRADEANKALSDLLGGFTVLREVSDLYMALMEDIVDSVQNFTFGLNRLTMPKDRLRSKENYLVRYSQKNSYLRTEVIEPRK